MNGLERLRLLEEANRVLEQEVVQHRMAAELARGQSEMLIQSLNFLAAESNLDKFLGHVLKVTVQQLQGVVGSLWFPDHANGSIRLYLEYLDSRIIPASDLSLPSLTATGSHRALRLHAQRTACGAATGG